MNTQQLYNIFRFSINFHERMGNRLYGFGPDYILEKWKNYFGELKPNPISDNKSGEIKMITKWVEIWGEESYIKLSKYLIIIYQINTKGFLNDLWLPSELISLFEKSTTGEISNVEYRGLHELLERQLGKWLENDNVNKEMIQINRDIKILSLLK